MDDDEVANRLIADLEAGAALVDRGEFTIDEAMARRKLAEHRLEDPDVWACLVIEAASLLGSSWVRVWVWPRKLHLQFDGQAIDGDELFVQAIASGVGADASFRLAMSKLAIAIDAVLGHHRGARIEIESPDSTVILRHQASNERRPGAGQYTTLRANGLETARAHELLIERCRYSPLAIVIDARYVSQGLRSFVVDEGCVEIHPIVDGVRTIGYAGWRGGEEPSIVQLLTHGVATERVIEPRSGFVAILDVPLDKDIGERSVIQDAEFERVFALVRATFDAIAARHPPATVPARPPAKPSARDPNRELIVGVCVVVVAVWVLSFLSSFSDDRPQDPLRPQAMPLSAGEAPQPSRIELELGDGQHHGEPRWKWLDEVQPIALERSEGVHRIAELAGPVTSIAILEDGKFVAAVGDRLVIWQLASLTPEPTWQAKGTLTGHAGAILDLAVLSTRRVVSASADETARIWDVDQTDPIAVLGGHADPVLTVVVTVDRRIVTMSGNREVRVWDSRGQPLGRPIRAAVAVHDLAPVWNGRTVDTRLWVSDVESNLTSPLVDVGSVEPAERVAADFRGRIVLAYPGSVRTWTYDQALSDRTFVIAPRSQAPTSGVVLLEGRPVTISGTTLRVWPASDEPMLAFVGPDPFTAVATSRAQLYVGDSKGRIWVFDPLAIHEVGSRAAE